VLNKISTRRLRILKYRGSEHGSNEYPFLIGKDGISVLPITSIGLDHEVSSMRISSGIDRLDKMLAGGYYQGSSNLISGTAGTGKTTFASIFASSVVSKNGKALFISFEESPKQIIRNMSSVGIEMSKLIKTGKFKIISFRPSFYGLETHLVRIHGIIDDFKPNLVVLDPISNLVSIGTLSEAKSMVTRLIDYLKMKQITSIFTILAGMGELVETEIGISSLMDNWIVLKDMEFNGERSHSLYVIKARGSEHSNQLREYIFTNRGIKLEDVYTGSAGVLTGTARVLQEEEEEYQIKLREKDIDLKKREIERKHQMLKVKISELENQFEVEKYELELEAEKIRFANENLKAKSKLAAKKRKAD